MILHQKQGKKAYFSGKRGELFARLFLRIQGYTFFQQGFRLPFVEVDLILTKKNILIFCEVKKRSSFLKAGEAISKKQKKRLLKGVRVFLKKYPHFQNHVIRFDAILLVPWRMPRHIKHAWNESYF